jgi:hypothetical protein
VEHLFNSKQKVTLAMSPILYGVGYESFPSMEVQLNCDISPTRGFHMRYEYLNKIGTEASSIVSIGIHGSGLKSLLQSGGIGLVSFIATLVFFISFR